MLAPFILGLALLIVGIPVTLNIAGAAGASQRWVERIPGVIKGGSMRVVGAGMTLVGLVAVITTAPKVL
jgi:threonine/homoserine/homoserine lactone efflux protein